MYLFHNQSQENKILGQNPICHKKYLFSTTFKFMMPFNQIFLSNVIDSR